MLQMAQLISPELVKCDWTLSSKKQLLRQAALEFSAPYPDLNPDDLFECLVKRERLGSTGIGSGIAIPHCRSSQCKKMVGLFTKLANPIDFDASDDQLVDLFFILLVPKENAQVHLEALHTITECLQDPRNRAKLRRSTSDSELFATLLDICSYIKETPKTTETIKPSRMAEAS